VPALRAGPGVAMKPVVLFVLGIGFVLMGLALRAWLESAP
jgi:hypothetical protein